MPHVIVKLWPGKSEQQKRAMTKQIVEAVTATLGYGEESVSVALQEISSQDWKDQVYDADIAASPNALYKKPGYSM